MNKKAVFINTASQVIVRFATLIFTLISVKLLTSYLGPNGVGNYNTITTYVNFFIVIADLGLFAVAVREISKDPTREKKILSNIFFIRLISALIASALAIVIVLFTHYSAEIKYGVFFGVGFLFFNLMSSIYDMALQHRLKMQYSAISEFLSKLLSLLALYLIIRFQGSFIEITSTIALSGFLVLFFKWLFSRQFIKFGIEFDRKISSWIFNLTWPLGLVFIVNNLFFKLDTLMLFAIKGSYAVGIYSVSYKILEVTAFIAGYFTSALKPTISREINTNIHHLANIISKSIIILCLVVTPISAISIAYSKEIIEFLSTKEFTIGYTSLILLSLSLPLIYLDTLLGELLIAKDSRKLLFFIALSILIFNFTANLIMIPRYSYIGAAITTLASEAILLAINYYYTRKIVPYRVNIKELLKISLVFITTLCFGFLIKLAGLYFLFSIAITFLSFLFFCQIFGTMKLSSIKSLAKIN